MNNKIFDGVLLMSDIDETLSRNRVIPRRNIDAIHRFITLGGKFVIATGRNLTSARQISDKLGIEQSVICLNDGACLYDLKNDAIIEDTILEQGYQELILDIYEKFPKVSLLFCDLRTTYMLRENEFTLIERDAVHSALKKIGAYKAVGLNEIPSKVNKSVIWDYKESIDELLEYLSDKHYENFDFVQSDPCNIEIVPKGVSKGRAMLHLCDALGLDKENTAAIGDYYNDEAMLRYAKYSCAPSGAAQAIKDVCGYVACDCADGSVGDFIEYLTKIYSNN